MSDQPSAPVPGLPDRPVVTAGIVVFDGVTLLDVIGPHTAFALAGMNVQLVAETLTPISTDTSIRLPPDVTIERCPQDLDIVCVPGGSVGDAMLDIKLRDFLRARAATARYVTSVCSGALILAAAGLLDGYRAATHWASRDLLAALGVEVSTKRVCMDRNRITGGGITAGIDFGLAVVGEVLGREVAEFVQLGMEYNPKPPFNTGSPETAGADLTALFTTVTKPIFQPMADATAQVLARRVAR
ncbi:glutamine amidotransferase [Actinoplanes sp. NBRC 103695]|nr:glutamine amidotransferase [Actinoplanes sp. NBRC 103695]